MKEYSWIKSYPDGVKWDCKIESKPVYSIFDDIAAKFPDNIAIDFLDKKYSYSELKELVDKAAGGFASLGVQKGTKVGLFLPNCPQFVISYYAIMKAGGTVVNFSPLYARAELEHQLKDSEIEIMVTLDLQLLYPKVRELFGKGKLNKLVVGNMPEVLAFPKNHLFPIFKRKEIANVNYNDDITKWSELIDTPSSDNFPNIDPENDIAVLQYTGGTTGVPKGAVLTHKNIYANVVQAGMWCNVDPEGEGRMLAVLPFFHVFSMTVAMNFGILKGMEIIIHPRFELKYVLKDIDKKKPTLMPGVPTMYTAINNYPKLDSYDLSSLKACISGGAGLPVEVKRKFESLTGCSLVEGYGLTETSPVACCNPLEGENKAGSIGLPLPNTIIRIEDMENKGNFLEAGEKGELCISGPQVMKEYWNHEKETSNVLDNGVLRTGDVAYMDDEGYVFIVDRIKELIIAGGFNIYPRNVEEAIYQHEAINEVAVIGISDPYRGQTVKAFIVLKKGYELTVKELKEFLKDRLGRHEIPTHIEFRDELPKTMIGKISKKDLQEKKS